MPKMAFDGRKSSQTFDRFASRRATLAGQCERAVAAVRRLLQGRSDTTKQ